MNILGIGGYSHDSAAALVCDGKVVAAVAEERLTRVKHQGGSPVHAVQYCLDAAGLSPTDIDHLGCYMQPGKRIKERWKYRLKQLPKSPFYSIAYMGYEILHNARYMRDMKNLCSPNTQLHYMEHHPAHVASAYHVSPFEDAALLSIDYIGEMCSTWSGVAHGNDIQPLHTINYPHSLGVFYSAITDYLGFLRASDEYKVMGLASYGEPEYYEDFKKLIVEDGAGYRMDLSWMAYHYLPGSKHGYFSDKFIQHFGPKRLKDEPVVVRHQNIAASAQKLLEEHVLRIATHLHEETQCDNLCLAGGVALNCSMNGRLLRESPFKKIFVQPAAGDDGIAIGAALQLHHEFSGTKQPRHVMNDARMGPEYSDEEILAAIQITGQKYTTPENLEAETAKHIAQGKIVGWYQGRMEFGPRALGARSILADPTNPDMQHHLNNVVKHREEFRPFAPSCLEEKAHEYFEGCHNSPFMLFVYPVIQEKQALLPAITHVDGTARVQTVSKDIMPRYHKMIAEFEQLSGVPVVINTSFNVMGEPIVNTPEDAIRCFLGTGIDVLVLGDHIIVKDEIEE